MGKTITVAMLLVVWAASGVAADDGAPYGGVTPGSDGSANLPPKAEEIPEGAAMLTWPGFMMRKEGGSRFFVQTSRPVEIATHQSEGRFELILRDTRVYLKNNFRPLETEFFKTPVTRATVQRRGKKNLAMVFELRVPATPTVTQEKGKDGFNYVFVDFAP
ncbi:MAG: hypothetical protein PVH21_01745 [Myxococcales bacterium]